MGIWDWVNSTSDTVKNHTPAITPATEFCRKSYFFCRDSTAYAAGTVSSKARDLHEYLSDDQARDNLTQIAKNVSKNGALYVARSYGGGPIIDIISRSVQENKSDSQKERLKELEHKVARLEKELISRNMAEQSKASAFDSFTMKCWYGGNFKTNGVSLEYVGGEFKILVVDPNIISWFDLEELVDTSVGIQYPHTLYYLLPNCLTFEEGLRNINSDACVFEMASIGAKERAIDVYIVREEDDESLFVCINKKLKLSIEGNIDGERRKLTPRRAQTVNLDKEKGNVVSGDGDDITSLVGVSEGDDSEDESYDFNGDTEASEEVSYVDSDEANTSENEVGQLSEYEDSESLLGSDNEVLEV